MDDREADGYEYSNLAEKLSEIEFISEHEARAYVYFDIMDDPEKEAEQIADIPEGDLEDRIEDVRVKIEAAKTTVKVEKLVEKPTERIDTLIGAGLLSEEEAKAYVHSERVDEETLDEMMDGSLSDIRKHRKSAEKKVDQSYEIISFLDHHTGIQKY